jgi:hypothetical protein
MRWLPEYGVGIIAFGNLRYTGWGPAIDDAIEALARTGALQPRVVQPSPDLIAARDAVSRLITQWDDALAAKIAADNLFLDDSVERRRAQLDHLRTKVGACTAPSSFDHVENALRGNWIMDCERGKLEVAITLAPTMPPKVQFLSVTEAAADPPPQQPASSCPRQ